MPAGGQVDACTCGAPPPTSGCCPPRPNPYTPTPTPNPHPTTHTTRPQISLLPSENVARGLGHMNPWPFREDLLQAVKALKPA